MRSWWRVWVLMNIVFDMLLICLSPSHWWLYIYLSYNTGLYIYLGRRRSLASTTPLYEEEIANMTRKQKREFIDSFNRAIQGTWRTE
jgi:hypothetical protein